jgi:hypothetical protein
MPLEWLEVNKRVLLRNVTVPQLAEIIAETMVHPVGLSYQFVLDNLSPEDPLIARRGCSITY